MADDPDGTPPTTTSPDDPSPDVSGAPSPDAVGAPSLDAAGPPSLDAAGPPSPDAAGTPSPDVSGPPSPDAAGGSSHDAVWFEGLVRQHATAVHRFMVRRAGRGDAEDLAADVLTVAWRRRAEVPDGAELPWLYRTAGFVVANHRRKGRPVPVGDVPDEVDPDDPALRAIQEERVREVLGSLSARDREILLLNAWEGVSGDALAQVLGTGRGGADAALSRARARLRDAWSSADS